MSEMSEANKKAWEYRAYEFWNKHEIHRVDAVSKRYFPAEEQENFPPLYTRLYTLSDIINAVIRSGFVIREFLEHPSWTNDKIPGEFTVYAERSAGGTAPCDA